MTTLNSSGAYYMFCHLTIWYVLSILGVLFIGVCTCRCFILAHIILSKSCAAAGLRGRSPANKAQIVSEVEKNVWPAVTAGKVKPVIYQTFPLSEAAEAHRLMEASTHIGKILLLPWLRMWCLNSRFGKKFGALGRYTTSVTASMYVTMWHAVLYCKFDPVWRLSVNCNVINADIFLWLV